MEFLLRRMNLDDAAETPDLCTAFLFENKEVRPHSMKRKERDHDNTSDMDKSEMRQALEATLEVGNYEARLQQVRDLGPAPLLARCALSSVCRR